MFGPESIGKHIAQPVANWVFPKGIGVWARMHRKTHNATSCELGFSKGIGVWARIHRKTHSATSCELGFSKGNRCLGPNA